ncbi:23S rRNA (guanosine-2'-O-)-methyltransferase RlmB [subsurface metagenome]
MLAPLKPLKWYKELSDKKGRLKGGAFIVEGDKAIRQIMSVRPDEITEIISIKEPPAAYRHYSARLVTESQFRNISSTRTPQGIMAVVRIPESIYSARLPEEAGNKILLLEDIQDPGNVGTLIRTAAAFGFSGVIMTENCADPLAPKCVQSTAGTVLSVWLRKTAQYLELVRSLRQGGYNLIAAELNGTAEPSVLKQEKLVLALGNEASGLSKTVMDEADHRLRIPTAREKAESLNVAACGAILMYLSSEK